MLDLATLGISISTAGILRAQDALRNLSGAAGAAANAALGLTGATGRADDAAARAARALGNLGNQGTGAAAGVNRLGQAAGNAQGRMDAMGRAATGSGAAMRGASGAADAMRNAMGGLLAAFGVGQLVQLTDEYTKFTAQLRLAATGASDYANALASVQQISTQSQQSIGAVGVLYARVANGTRELGLSQQQLAEIVGTVGLSLSVSGATASESSSAMLQLSQAFASGVLRGEEFNAVNEAAPRLMKALAEGMGVPIGALKKMAEEGKITSEVMAIALPKALRELTEEAKEVATISGAFTVLNNQILQFVGASANSSGAISAITTTVVALAENLNVLTVAAATLVGVKLANWATAGVASIVSMTAANGALLASNLAAAQAQVTATATSAVLTAARLAEVRAAVLASAGTVQLALVTNGLIPAQAAAAAAAAAHSAALGTLAAATGAATIGTRALNAALMFIGSPLGLITAALGIGASAWLLWGNNAEKGTKQAAGAVEATSEEIVANLQKQIEKAQERLDLIKGGNVELAKSDSPVSQEAAKQLAEINRLKAQGNKLSGAEQIGLIDKEAALKNLLALESTRLGIQEKTTSALEGDKAAALLLKLATPLEKMNAELAKYQKELGAAFTPEMEKRIRAQYDTKAKGAGAAAAAVKKEATAYEKLIADIKGRIEANGLEAASGDAVTESQKMRIKLDRDLAAGSLKLTAANEQSVRAKLAEFAASEALLSLEKDREKSLADTLKLIEDTQQTDAKTVASAIEAATTAEEQLRNYGLLKSEVMSLTLAQLENARESAALAGEDVSNIQKRIEAQQRLIAATRGLESREAADKTAKDAADASTKAAADATAEWQKTADSINSSLTDALMRGFEDGKGFAKNLRDTLVNMFKTMVLRPIISAVLAPIAGGLSGAANAAGGGGGIGGAISAGKSLYDSINGTVSSSIKDSFGQFARSSSGQSLGLSESSAMGPLPGGGSLTANGQMMSTGLQVLGDTMAGYAMGSMARTMISGGYSMGKGMESFQKVGIAVGSAIGGPVLGAIIGAAAGIQNRLFGRKLKDSGIEGSFGGDRGFEGNSFEFLKGGLFRSNKTNTNPLAEEARAALGDAFAGMRVQVGTFATALGLNTDQIAGFTSNIKLSLKGLSEADADKKIKEALATANNELAQQVLGTFTSVSEQITKSVEMRSGFGDSLEISYGTVNETITKTSYVASEFARDGELAIDTLKRLSGSLMVVNGTFDTLGYKLLETSLAGGDLASKLADAFGGLENLAAATATYYEAFYSEQERTATGVRQLTETLGKLGIALPDVAATDALEQYKALVNGAQALGEAGFTTYAALVTLSGGFAQLVSSTEQLGQAATQAAEIQRRAAEEMLSAATGRTDAAFAALERAVGAQRRTIDTQLAAAQSLASEVSSIFDTLKSSVADLYRSVQSTAQQGAADARAFIGQALSGALATGALPDSKALQAAISAANAGMDGAQFATQFEADRERLVMAGQLAQLKEIAGDQLSEAERQIQLLQGQLSVLDSTLDAARAQIDLLRGIDATLLTIAQALAGVSKAAGTEAIVRAGQGSIGDKFGAYNALIASGMSNGDIRKEADATLGKQTQTDWDFLKQGANQVKQFIEYLPNLAEQTAADKARAYQSLIKTGLNDQDIRKVVEQQLGVQSQSDWAYLQKLAGVPGFAVGTNRVPRDMLAQIHEGEMIVPKAFNPATSGIGAGNNERLEKLVEGLTAEVTRLRSDVARGNENTRQLADQFDSVSAGGNALATEVMT